MLRLNKVCVVFVSAVLCSFVFLLQAQDVPSKKGSNTHPLGLNSMHSIARSATETIFREPDRSLRRTENRPT